MSNDKNNGQLNNAAAEILNQAAGQEPKPSNANGKGNPSFDVKDKKIKKRFSAEDVENLDVGSALQAAKHNNREALGSKIESLEIGIRSEQKRAEQQVGAELVAFMGTYSEVSKAAWQKVSNEMADLHNGTAAAFGAIAPSLIEEGEGDEEDFLGLLDGFGSSSTSSGGMLPGGQG